MEDREWSVSLENPGLPGNCVELVPIYDCARAMRVHQTHEITWHSRVTKGEGGRGAPEFHRGILRQ